ncbi:antibiotic biosynthesis monooxygenase [Streptomyces sp. C1-2]|uniref:antibiotic biosynthesis monooxygenase n=1 Tax=Streptomyces sp. C1-2 TaxID=2720022 RepID=UPI001432697F|nr:antibiotic biosynthesis monooxygenase [Streptomyces sp. C1-2]NJP74943.1 hypothetical protein [Streptomyces sp. C1-2]
MSETLTDDEILRVRAGSDVVTAIEQFGIPGTQQAAASAKEGAGAEQPLGKPSTERISERVSEAQIESAVAYLRNELSATTGFVAGLLLIGQSGELVLYSQWTSQADAPVEVLPEWSLAPAVQGLDRIDSRTFGVDFTAPDVLSEASLKATPHVHFGVFTVEPDKQEHLLDLAREHAPTSMGVPGLTTINFHRSLDGRRVINLGLWSGFGEFENLLTRPSFAQGDEYWNGVATFRPRFFEVAAVVTA